MESMHICIMFAVKLFVMHPIVQKLHKESLSAQIKNPAIADFEVGDTINVHVKISEGNKERIQPFQGTVLQRRHRGSAGGTFTVRKLSGQVGVIRIFPFLSPRIEKIVCLRKGRVRRARLFYLRNLRGKAARVKERI